ncbi:hypothetical protein F5X96DRAFT_642370 [Biscogniauxia mediterranea]|nr:hypothetical protein F5X96DRAFT_642370 [Biscogniauxia mediterranea]
MLSGNRPSLVIREIKVTILSLLHAYRCQARRRYMEFSSRQKQQSTASTSFAGLRQVEYSRTQDNDSAKQGNVIFIFTVITIVFLPLPFLSSLFALDVSSFPHDGGKLEVCSAMAGCFQSFLV